MPLLPAQREGTFPYPRIPIPHAPIPHSQVVTSSGEDTGTAVTFEALYAEFNAKYAEPLRIMKFTSRRATRRYAFDQSDVPQESEYLQVMYSAEYPAPPLNASGRTFSRVFGTTTSRLSLPPHPSSAHSLTTSPPHSLTMSLPHSLTTSLPHSLTPLLCHSLTPSLPHPLTPSLPHPVTLSLPPLIP